MLAARVAVLVLLVACAGLARAADEQRVPDIDNNEVLPENDVMRARMDDEEAAVVVPVTARGPPSTSTTPEMTTPSSTAGPPTTTPIPSTTAKDTKDAAGATPTTDAPPRQPSTLSRFLSDIIQIPINVLRSVGSLLSNTFTGHRNAGGSGSVSTPSPSEATSTQA